MTRHSTDIYQIWKPELSRGFRTQDMTFNEDGIFGGKQETQGYKTSFKARSKIEGTPGEILESDEPRFQAVIDSFLSFG
jgi:hypothetical protein